MNIDSPKYMTISVPKITQILRSIDIINNM